MHFHGELSGGSGKGSLGGKDPTTSNRKPISRQTLPGEITNEEFSDSTASSQISWAGSSDESDSSWDLQKEKKLAKQKS